MVAPISSLSNMEMQLYGGYGNSTNVPSYANGYQASSATMNPYTTPMFNGYNNYQNYYNNQAYNNSTFGQSYPVNYNTAAQQVRNAVQTQQGNAAQALTKAEAIEKFGKLELSAKAGESGKLFGTITTKKLTEELQAQAGIEVDRKSVSLNAPINKIGEYKMLIKLTSKVKTELKVVVTASEVVKESIEEVEETVEA